MLNSQRLKFMKTWPDDKLKAWLGHFKKQSMFISSRREMESALNFALAIEKELRRRGVVG